MENKDILKYCPRCSGPAGLDRGSRKIVCDGCGFRVYLNTAAAVAGLFFDGAGRLLAVRRNREPRSGFLDLPGGFVDFNETAEEALTREVREEFGIAVCGIGYYKSIPNKYLYGDVLYHTLDIFFTCRFDDGVDPGSIRTNEEIRELVWKRPRDISDDEIAFDSMKRLIRGMRESD
jgi:NADH pyrophosphatase NudC (nudix superfamily)